MKTNRISSLGNRKTRWGMGGRKEKAIPHGGTTRPHALYGETSRRSIMILDEGMNMRKPDK